MTTNLLSVIEQLVDALKNAEGHKLGCKVHAFGDHCTCSFDAQIDTALTAGKQALEQMQGEVDELAFEAALAELVDKICPGLDSGDLLDDARTASMRLTHMIEPAIGGRESVEDALAIVESFGPGVAGVNDTYARQILLAEEVKRLRTAHPQATELAPSTAGERAIKPMTPQRAAYFMERFKHEEKLLGPNEQAAIDYVLTLLSAPALPPESGNLCVNCAAAGKCMKRQALCHANGTAMPAGGLTDEQIDAIAGGKVDYFDRRVFARAILAAARTQPVREPLLWLPIESAPEGLLVAVGWIDKEDGTAHYDFDYLEDGVWQRYFDYYEHLVIAGAPGRAEDAPYTYWMDIAHLPAAHGITKKGAP